MRELLDRQNLISKVWQIFGRVKRAVHQIGNLFVGCGKVSQSVSESHVAVAVAVSSDFLPKLALWISSAETGTGKGGYCLAGEQTTADE